MVTDELISIRQDSPPQQLSMPTRETQPSADGGNTLRPTNTAMMDALQSQTEEAAEEEEGEEEEAEEENKIPLANPRQETPPQADSPSQETSLLDASSRKILRLGEVMQILPYLCETLHSAVCISAYNAEIPKNWLFVAFTNLYESTDRAHNPRLRREDPNLLRRFLEADVNISLRDPRVNGGHIRNFLRSKYGPRGSDLMEPMGIPSLGWHL